MLKSEVDVFVKICSFRTAASNGSGDNGRSETVVVANVEVSKEGEEPGGLLLQMATMMRGRGMRKLQWSEVQSSLFLLLMERRSVQRSVGKSVERRKEQKRGKKRGALWTRRLGLGRMVGQRKQEVTFLAVCVGAVWASGSER